MCAVNWILWNKSWVPALHRSTNYGLSSSMNKCRFATLSALGMGCSWHSKLHSTCSILYMFVLFFVSQLSAQTNEKEVALQQVTFLQNQMRECEQKIQELEAAKEQLEQDSFSTHSHFQELEELHKQVETVFASKCSRAVIIMAPPLFDLLFMYICSRLCDKTLYG